MKIMIAGASGFIGRKLTKKWTRQGMDVVVVGRSTAKLRNVFGPAAQALSWESIAERGNELTDKIDAIINLSGAGVADRLWTKKRRREILQSRTEPTKALAAFAVKSRRKKPVLLNASAIGIYGLHQNKADGSPPVFDETAPLDAGKDSFLASVCRRWEAAAEAAVHGGVRVVHMRFGHVLGKEGGMLGKMVLPFSLGLGCVLGDGTQRMSWISLDDLCAVMEFLIGHQEISGPVNCVAPAPVTNKEFSKALAEALKRPCFLRAPAGLLKLAPGTMAEELFLNSQSIEPGILLEKGFSFKDKDLKSFFKRIMV